MCMSVLQARYSSTCIASQFVKARTYIVGVSAPMDLFSGLQNLLSIFQYLVNMQSIMSLGIVASHKLQ